MNQHQVSHATEYNRYPDIFSICAQYYNNKPVNILSFGCADGTEVFTLRELYFPNAEIDGVDISKAMIDACNARNTDPKISFFLTSDIAEGKVYDIIFCMSVLCRWPQTQHIDDCSGEYTFPEFCNQLSILNTYLKPGGLLVIYNANFCFFETGLYASFTPVTDDRLQESGFVHKFNQKHKKIDINYKDSIFLKKA